MIQRPNCMNFGQSSVSISLSPASRSCAGPRPASGDSGRLDRADDHEEGAVAVTERDRIPRPLRCKSVTDRRILSGAYGAVSAGAPLDSQPDQLAARDMGGRPFARSAVRSLGGTR
jgi:hypothetical protein